ncbi:heme exporter protein CcmB [Legionella nagasakiensis]|uniref:heme exporter protein CcmB n=1 Tax=Legionella nagasakiensis TaxID=535290 RepID=UPI001054871C|nr:heme exporter protein CcmB [Legionella nagasakiensis]
MISLGALFKRQLWRETLLLTRQLRFVINASLFFLMVLIFFPLTMPADHMLLRMIAPGLIWIALLLALIMSAERLFQQDYEDGVIEQWLVSGYPVSLMVLAKILMHWLFNLLPLVVICPVFAVIFALNGHETMILIGSLICGSPALLFLCALAAVFSGGLKQKGIFMALILLPLTVPVMIFGSGAVTVAMQGMAVRGYLALLLAMSLVAACLLPVAIAAMMRISMAD